MKSRFIQNEESSEEENEKKQESQNQQNNQQTEAQKPSIKSRFAVGSDDEEENEQSGAKVEDKQVSKVEPDGDSDEEGKEEDDRKATQGTATKKAKKKKKGQPMTDDQNATEKAEEKPDESKAKKKKPINAVLKKKIEEERKRKEEIRMKARDAMQEYVLYLRGAYLEDLFDFAQTYRKKHDKTKEKEQKKADGVITNKRKRAQAEKDQIAREAFIQSQRAIEEQIMNVKGEQTGVVGEEPKKRHWQKRRVNHQKRGDDDVEVVVKQTEQTVVEPLPREVEEKVQVVDSKTAVVECDDWENMVVDVSRAKETAESVEINTVVGQKESNKATAQHVTPENQQGSVSEVKKERKTDTQTGKRNDTKTGAKSDAKSDAKDAKTDAESDAKTDPKGDTKTDAKSDPKIDSKLPKQIDSPVVAETAIDVFNLKSKFRCPIICIMGHVDTGKTKLLDHIRKTNVQGGEAGGITQQIGASFFPQGKLKEEIAKVDKKVLGGEVEIPGLLIIDTPGHEAFANLRSRGSSLCDLAIVVVDVMHGLENQTIESIRMLQEKGTPFVIALNKIDRLYQWSPANDQSSYINFLKQTSFVQNVFQEKYNFVIASMAKLDINVALYWKQESHDEYVSVVPTSAITGEGVPDLLGFLTHYAQNVIPERIMRNDNEFKATVLEVKKAEGVGSTIDIIVVNGSLSIDDKVVLSGFDGPIKTFVKGLLTPHPLKELRVKSEYIHHQKIFGAMGVRLVAPGLETAIAGSSVFRYDTTEEADLFSEELQKDIKRVKKIIKLSKEGVGVAASSLGSLEALLVFLKQSKIPVSTICIGDVSKNDLLKVLTPFLQEEGKDWRKRKLEFLTMLCFDVKILPEAFKFGEENDIKMISAKIIYHLFDGFTKHVEEIIVKRKKEFLKLAVFPCVLKQVSCFNTKNPIILGVDVVEGVLKIGTPLCVVTKECLKLGVVESIESNKKPILEARKKNGSVAIRLKSDPSITHGRHFELGDQLVSVLSRESIEVLKEFFRDDMTDDDWNLVRKLKPVFNL